MSQVQAYEHLLEMDVSFSGMLDLKPDAVCRAVETDAFGADSLWSESLRYALSPSSVSGGSR